ncbi:hypothetical protein [Paenibacillus guangzhouensis]|uniref:hypothetical protein n=1 Tax=Paenibacillus guangzhouensis TaxID=1473112 RepID=UPI0012672621|nr:hypothetical protein [Paenibacillus guangzhouensis]
MKGNKENRSDNVPESLEGKSLEELWELLLGKEDLEERKAKYEARKLKPDYREDAMNILECPMCGCDDVPNELLTIPVNMKGIVSVNVLGAKCSNPECLEEYYNSEDTEVIRQLKELIKQQALIGRIKPMHLQSEEYQKSSAEATRDDDENG